MGRERKRKRPPSSHKYLVCCKELSVSHPPRHNIKSRLILTLIMAPDARACTSRPMGPTVPGAHCAPLTTTPPHHYALSYWISPLLSFRLSIYLWRPDNCGDLCVGSLGARRCWCLSSSFIQAVAMFLFLLNIHTVYKHLNLFRW